MNKLSSNLKKLLICSASLVMITSLGSGISNVSAHTTRRLSPRYSRVAVHHHHSTTNTRYHDVMHYLHYVKWYEHHYHRAYTGWHFRHINHYEHGLRYYQKKNINNYVHSLNHINKRASVIKRSHHQNARHHRVHLILHNYNHKQSSMRAPKALVHKVNHHHVNSHVRTDSRVNNYILDHDLHHSKITYNIDHHFPHLAYRHGIGHPEGVVVHETGNPYSNIYGEIAFMKRDFNNAFVHSFVDSNHIINIGNTKYQAWGVGYPGNARFVQFEQVEMHNKRDFAKEVNNSAWYVAHLLHAYHLTPKDAEYSGHGTVWSHASVAKYMGGSDHVDPVTYYRNCGYRFFGQPYTMHQFYHLVLHYYYND